MGDRALLSHRLAGHQAGDGAYELYPPILEGHIGLVIVQAVENVADADLPVPGRYRPHQYNQDERAGGDQ